MDLVGNRFTEGFEMQCVGCMGGLAGVAGRMCSLETETQQSQGRWTPGPLQRQWEMRDVFGRPQRCLKGRRRWRAEKRKFDPQG